jgi:hypothetical protein
MYSTLCAALLLVVTPGCYEHSEMSKIDPTRGTNAEPATGELARTNYASQSDANAEPAAKQTATSEAPQRFPALTNATLVDNDGHGALMAVWRSPDSTPNDRASAVTKWLPQDTSIASAKALLGDDGALSHYFGPSFISGAVDDWVLEYDTPGGLVILRFSRGPGGTNRLRFDGAYARERRQPLPSSSK